MELGANSPATRARHETSFRSSIVSAHSTPPGRIIPGAEVFVVWACGLASGAQAQNLGALKVDKNLNGKITAVTAMPSFDLFITCEQSQTVTVPASPELLAVHYASK